MLALLIGFGLLSLTMAGSSLRGLQRPSAGFVYYQQFSGEVEAYPITAEAVRKAANLGQLDVRQVNGNTVGAGRLAIERVAPLLERSTGATNRFSLVDSNGRPHELELSVSAPALFYLIQSSPEQILYPIVSLLYLALGLWVWWKRPNDRAATPMLVFTLVGAYAFQNNLGLDDFARFVGLLQRLALPFYGPALIDFGVKFTGYHQHPGLAWATRGALVAAAVSSAFQLLYAGNDAVLYAWAQNLVGVLVAASVLICIGLGVMAARAPNPLALRRRGRLLAKSILVALLLPSLSMLIDWPGARIVNASLMTTFPAAMAYAIVRHGVFNFRIVLRQGLVYALLSVSVLLFYLATALWALELAEQSEQTAALSAAVVGLFVIVLSLLQLRVQGAINRFVFRSRYLFSEAIAQASARLASAKTRAAVTDAVSAALLGKLRLSRAALAVANADQLGFECIALETAGTGPRDLAGPNALPARLWPERLAPLRRALLTQSIVTAYDSAAATAQVALADRAERDGVQLDGRCDEGSFWSHFGLEAVVPLSVGTESNSSRVVGFLLLGPKLDGKPLDSTDEHLIFTLANQLAVALENTAAFDEIRSLKDNLERQVAERTRDLSDALSNLKRAQVQLIESEKQAMLGRLVAGMAHEINTPLGTLRSSADTLGRFIESYRRYVALQSQAGDAEAMRLERSSNAVDRLFTVMASSADRLNQLVGSLKRFVSLDQAPHQRLDVRESIDSALAVLGPSLTPEITIRQNYVDADLSITGDPAKLNQLFWNLLQNSLAALKGKGEIVIDARRDQGQIEVNLSDNGIGITEERLQYVFDFGFTQKNGRVGLRLGLPTSKLTVTELGGEISIESIPGEGTSVHLRLPA